MAEKQVKKVTFNLDVNSIKVVERVEQCDIIGTIGIDNWMYESKLRRMKERQKRKEQRERRRERQLQEVIEHNKQFVIYRKTQVILNIDIPKRRKRNKIFKSWNKYQKKRKIRKIIKRENKKNYKKRK